VAEDILNQPVIDENSDRRLDFRIKSKIPIEFQYHGFEQRLEKGAALASQLSRRGLTFSASTKLSVNSEILLKIPIPNSKYPVDSTAKITWAISKNGNTMYGVEFLHIPQIHLPFLNRFISQNMATRSFVQERRIKSQIISELVEFRNRSGLRIVGFYDHLLTTSISAPFIIIPAAYGETKLSSLQIAYYLANNGFNVLRFDTSNHVGESEGETLNYSLPSLKQDIVSAIDYVQIQSPEAQIGIVAASMAARAAIKVVSEDLRPSFLISLVGVVNMRYTLNKVQNIDLFGLFEKGKIWGITNVLGFDVKLDRLLGECISESYDSLESTRIDLRDTKCPVVFMVGDKDPWVDPDEAKAAICSVPENIREVYFISAMHKLKENPNEAKRAFRQIVLSASNYLSCGVEKIEEVVDPKAREVGLQSRLERERSRHLTSFDADDEKVFWKDYLHRFHYIYSIADYRDLLDTVYSELGSIDSSDSLLDVGCGNGNFGLWLLMKISEELKRESRKPLFFNYTGIDIVLDALKCARELHASAQVAMQEELNLSHNLMNTNYCAIDLNKSLPFLDEAFEKICSNLVISYLTNPVFSLRELVRILKPGGKLVITTLKKDADVSQVYRNFVEKATNEKEIEEARNLLRNAGKILVKESEGYFRFYSERELQNLLNQAAPNCTASYRKSFSDQAIVLTITK
jgi:SAM-dependent methyltransferase/pimeloyl-ACP methyl ester carboxylesterase